MSECDLVKISAALADRLRTLRVDGVAVNAYDAYTPTVKFPCVIVWDVPSGVQYHQTHGPEYLVRLQYELRIGVGGRPQDAANFIRKLLSVGSDQPASVADLFDMSLGADNTLGGLVNGIFVKDATRIPPADDFSNVFEAAIPLEITTNRKAT